MHFSDAEWKVMTALWEGHPASVRDVMNRLDGKAEWAYTTIKTMLSRLVDKGAIRMEKKGNVSYFTPLVSKTNARKSALRELVNHAFDGALGPLLHFLLKDEKLSRNDREQLEELLRKQHDEGAKDD